MITQISGPSAGVFAKDPRRTSQRIQFKNSYNSPNISYKSNYDEEYKRQQRNALKTSIAIVLGSLAFMTGYFMLSGLKSIKK